MYKYEILIYWSKQDEAFIAEVPELSSLMAHGDSAIEALENIHDAIQLWIEVAKEDGIPIPEPKGKLSFA
jgi:predicted RNase H-like HicB family nuclease